MSICPDFKQTFNESYKKMFTQPEYKPLCEECEEEITSFYCVNCEEYLCTQCDKNLHKKAKRAEHERRVVSNPEEPAKSISSKGNKSSDSSKFNADASTKLEDSQANTCVGPRLSGGDARFSGSQVLSALISPRQEQKAQQSVESTTYKDLMFMPRGKLSQNFSFDDLFVNLTKNRESAQQQESFFRRSQSKVDNSKNNQVIPTTQLFKNIEINYSLRISHYLQQEMMSLANSGTLLIDKKKFEMSKGKAFREKFDCEISDVLAMAEKVQLIHTTTRIFLDTEPMHYFGILLDNLTIESLIWVVKSIKNDSMTPTEKLIQSRIKESYGLKIDPVQWKQIVDMIVNQTDGNFPLTASKYMEPTTQVETYVIFPTYEEWIPEDQGTIKDSKDQWICFLGFMDNFFRQDNTNSKIIWSSSVENVLNRTNNNSKNTQQKVSDDVRAIPGGRYGCAQFVKLCGPDAFKKLSIGRIILFVQEAINKGMLKYERTLLIRNPNYPSQTFMTDIDANSQEVTDSKKAKTIKRIKECLLDILIDHPDGISFAQIPILLRKKLRFTIHWESLGFPKLKNFLTSQFSDLVKIESSGANHSFATCVDVNLAKKMKKDIGQKSFFSGASNTGSTNNTSRNLNGSNSNTSISSGGHNSSMNMSQNSSNQKMYPNIDQYTIDTSSRIPGKFNTFTPQTESRSSESINSIRHLKKNNSTFDDYLKKVKNHIQDILKENNYGIMIDALHKYLDSRLGFNFDQKIFNLDTFHSFLLHHAENFCEIEMKKTHIVVYPKHSRFGLGGSGSQQVPPRASFFGNDTSRTRDSYVPNRQSIQKQQYINTPPGLGKVSSNTRNNVNFSPILYYDENERNSVENNEQGMVINNRMSMGSPHKESEGQDSFHFIDKLLRDSNDGNQSNINNASLNFTKGDHSKVENMSISGISSIHADNSYMRNQSDEQEWNKIPSNEGKYKQNNFGKK